MLFKVSKSCYTQLEQYDITVAQQPVDGSPVLSGHTAHKAIADPPLPIPAHLQTASAPHPAQGNKYFRDEIVPLIGGFPRFGVILITVVTSPNL